MAGNAKGQEMTYEERYNELLKKFLDTPIGQGAETAATVGTGMLGQAAGGIAGLGRGAASALRGGDFLPEALRGLEDTQQGLTYQPQGEGGKAGVEMIGKVGEAAMQPFYENIADPVGEASPLLGAAVAAVGEMAGGKGKPRKFAGPGTSEALRAPKSIENMTESKSARQEAAIAALESDAMKRNQDPSDLFEAPAKEPSRTREEIAKRPPRIYRDMASDKGDQAVLDAANAGHHIRPQAGGGFIGYPRTVKTMDDIQAMRSDFDSQVNDAAEAVKFAEDTAGTPQRAGSWYERAQEGHREVAEPYMYPRVSEQSGVFSAGVAPVAETAFALRYGASRGFGNPEKGFRKTGDKTLDKGVESGAPANLKFKVDEYRKKNDPLVELSGPFGVNDFRMAQSFGYTDPSGQPWRAGVQDTMHPVMDAETALAVQRLNQNLKPGEKPATGATTQELPWVYGKAGDFFGRYRGGKYSDDNAGRIAALRDANNTGADYKPAHAWTMPSDTDWSLTDAGGRKRDSMYSALGLQQYSPGDAGVHPLTGFQTIAKAGTPNVPSVNTRKSIGAVESLRALSDELRQGKANMPVTTAARTGQNSVLLERMGYNETGNPTFKSGTADEIAALKALGLNAEPTMRGTIIRGKSPRDAAKILTRREELERAMPGGNPMQAAIEDVTVQGISPASQAGQGKATAAMLRKMADAPEKVALDLSESPAVRGHLKSRIGTAKREDLKKTLSFLSDADWNKAVKMIRGGMKPAAAVAALGYSLQGMAAEDEQ